MLTFVLPRLLLGLVVVVPFTAVITDGIKELQFWLENSDDEN